jgi:peptidoglycan/LPS O-acetylase OafA/YrhL
MHFNNFLLRNLTGFVFIKKLKALKLNLDVSILIIMVLTYFVLNYQLGYNYHNGLFSVFFIPLILLISMNKGIITKISNLKMMVYLGEISYGVYILQLPIYLWTTQVFRYKK